MDVREKLVELLGRVQQMGVIYKENQMDERYPTIEQIRNTEVAARLIAYGVTVQEWISVEDRLPQYTDEYNVTVGVPSEFGYFEKVKTLRFERIKGKEPRWIIPKNEIYNVIAWMELPKKYQPPKGE